MFNGKKAKGPSLQNWDNGDLSKTSLSMASLTQFGLGSQQLHSAALLPHQSVSGCRVESNEFTHFWHKMDIVCMTVLNQYSMHSCKSFKACLRL